MATKVTTGLITDNAITDAKIANVAITGVTASSGDSSTALATTAFVAGEINSLIDSAPGALNTLNELAAALGDDANFSTTVTNSIATKLPLAGGTLTGDLSVPNISVADDIKHTGDSDTYISLDNNSQIFYSGGTRLLDLSVGDIIFNEGGGGVDFRVESSSDANMFFVDGSANAIGIGTNTPASGVGTPLTLQSSTGYVGLRLNGTGSAVVWDLYSSYNGGVGMFGVYDRANTRYNFVTRSDGNFGVGTEAPDRLFHVKRSDSGGTVAKFENSAGTVYVELNTNNQASGDAGYISYDSSMNLGLWTDDQQRVTIDSAGNAAIVDGDLEFSASTGNHTISVADYTGDAYLVGDRGNIEIKASSSPNSGGQAKSGGRVLLTAGNSYNGQSGDIVLSTGVNHLNASDKGKIRFNIGGTASGDEAMRIAPDGNVGIGTNSPSVNLHVRETASNSYGYLRLQGANRGGWIQMYDGSNAVSSILTDQSGNMYFDTASGYGGNNPTTRMTIEAGGNIHVEATSSGSEFKVDSTGSGGNDVGLSTKLPGYTHNLYSNFFSSGNNIYFVLGGSYVGYINSAGAYNPSDERLKKDVTDLTGSLDKIKSLRGVNFKWIDESRGTDNRIGLIAQEVEPVIPEVVGDGGLPSTEDGEPAMKSIDYGHIVPHLVEAIKEQQTIIEDLKTRIETLEG